MNRIICTLLVIALAATFVCAEETSFNHVRVPNQKGKLVKAVLTFNDQDKAFEVRPAKGDPIKIPYAQIDKCAYEYSVGLMNERDYWLEVHYRAQDAPKVFVLHMDSHNYLRILDALKIHTGLDAEILGNAKKR